MPGDTEQAGDVEAVAARAAAALIATTGVTSVAAGVVGDHAAGFSGGFGALASTAFRVASITKTFTAVALMQQYEAGRFGLDDPVNDHLDTVRVTPPAGGAAVTIRHLLTHSAGIGELLGLRDLRRPYAGFAVRPGTPIPSLRSVYEPVVRTAVAAEAKSAYANHGFGLLGVLLEDLSGDEYGDYVRTRVLDPLGMVHTDIRGSARVGVDMAVGYRPRGGRRAMVLELTVPPAGGAWSSVQDLQRYAEALVGGGANQVGRVLRPETIALMYQAQFGIDPRLPSRGLCFALGQLGAHAVAGHDGALPGFSSTLQFAPDAGSAAMVLANANSLDISAAVHRLGRDLLGLALDQPAASLTPSATAIERPATWPGLRGAYVPERGILTSTRVWRGSGPLIVHERGGHLELRSAYGAYRRGVRLRPDSADPGLFRFTSRGLVATLAFQTTADGTAHHLCLADDTGQHRLRRARRRR